MPVTLNAKFFRGFHEIVAARRDAAKEHDAVEYTYWCGAADAIEEIIIEMTEQESGELPC